MIASLQSLPPEVVLHILEFLGPSNDWQSELDPTRRSPDSTTTLAPLLATSLVDRRLGQLSQQVLFRSVHLRYHSQAYRWRETAAGAYTQAVRVSFCERGTGHRSDSHPGSLPLSSLFGLSEVHEATRRKVGIKSLWAESCCTGDFKEGLAGTGMLQGLEYLRITSLFPLSNFPSLVHLSVHTLPRSTPLALHPLPSVTHISISSPPYHTTSSPTFRSFPNLTHLTINDLPPFAFILRLLPALSSLPPSLTHFATAANLPAPIARALPASVTHLTLGPQRGADLRVVLDRWFGPEGPGLRNVVLVGLTEDEVVRYYARGAEFLERVQGAGAEVECRKDWRLEWR